MKSIISGAVCFAILASGVNVLADTEYAPSGWAEDSIVRAQTEGIVPGDFYGQWTGEITRERFCNLIYTTLSRAGIDLPQTGESQFDDISDDVANSLYSAGIINGKSERIFAPNDGLTREEAATIIYRAAEFAKVTEQIEAANVYSDSKDISEWALKAVNAMNGMGIMEGVSNNRFSPKEVYTVEQSVVTLERLYTKLTNTEQAVTAELFADKLNAQMPKNQNYMFSPMSIKMALALAANGAQGETRSEILKAVGIGDIDEFNNRSKEMIEKYSAGNILRLDIANSIWINSDVTDYTFSGEYKNKIAEYYGGSAETVNNATAVKKVNDWVRDKTEGKITSITDDSDFLSLLVNAIYFKGSWQNEFNEIGTAKAEFTDRNGNKTDIDFMNKTMWLRYYENNGLRIAELPYKTTEYEYETDENGVDVISDTKSMGEISMYVILSDKENPNAQAVIEDAVKNNEFQNTYIKFSMPKFKLEYSTGIIDMLKNIGIEKAFKDGTAEFQPMFDGGNMYIAGSMHKTYIEVDEKGTEAAAVTGFRGGTGALPPQAKEFSANVPFTFVIYDKTENEVLFMGEYAFAQ